MDTSQPGGKASARRPNNGDRALSEEKKALVEDNNLAKNSKTDERHASSATISSASVTPPPSSVVVMAPNPKNNNNNQDKESSGSSGTVASSLGKPETSNAQVQFDKRTMEKQQSQVASALPERMKQHRQLKKYASETSFRLSPIGTFQAPRRLDFSTSPPPPAQSFLPITTSLQPTKHNSVGNHQSFNFTILTLFSR